MTFKKIYVLAWLTLAAVTAATLATGNFNELTMLAVALGTLGLVHALAVWSVVVNTAPARST